MKTRIAVNGACGRMGLRIVQMAHADPAFKLVAALEAAQHRNLGRDIGDVAGIGKVGVLLGAELPSALTCDAAIDFSQPEGTMALLPACVRRRLPLVIATTGLTAPQRQEIEAAARQIAILMAPNMSLAVNVLMHLVRRACALLRGNDFDVEIVERHHRFKKDAPSGTALEIARVIQDGMGQTSLRHGREGMVGERTAEEIGIHALRVGDNVGEHTIVCSTLGETLELTHRAHSRNCYARGALQAARYLVGRPAGLYSMGEMLGT